MRGGSGSKIALCAKLLNVQNVELWMPDLGGGVIKQRVARPGQGLSGGYRVLIAYRFGDRSVFLYGFAKNERENIEEDELATLREIAAGWLEADDKGLNKAIETGILQEVQYGKGE